MWRINLLHKKKKDDITFVIEKRRIHFESKILIQVSEKFRSMFCPTKLKGSTVEVSARFGKYQDFVDFMNFVYPTDKTFTQQNLTPVLDLARYYEVGLVKEKAENFLMKSRAFDQVSKSWYADEYDMKNLERQVFESFATVKKSEIPNLAASQLF